MALDLWRERTSGDICNVVFTDHDRALEFWLVLVVYFGCEEPGAEWMDEAEFFATHDPERRMH